MLILESYLIFFFLIYIVFVSEFVLLFFLVSGFFFILRCLSVSEF